MPILAAIACSKCRQAALPNPTGVCRACRGLPKLGKAEPLEIPGSPAPKRPASPQRPSAPPPVASSGRRYQKGENVLTPRPATVAPPAPKPKPPKPQPKPKKSRPATLTCRVCSIEFPTNTHGPLRVTCGARACTLRYHANYMKAFNLKKRERLRGVPVATPTPPTPEPARTSRDELHAHVALEAEIEVKIPRDVAEEVRRTRPGENLAAACLALIREALGRREAEPVGGDSLIARVERLEALVGSGVVASKRRLEVGEEGATLDGRRVRLAPNEHRILQRLARAEGEWIELDGDRYAVWKGISRLRQALESAGLRRPIENRRGRYRLDPDCVSVFSRSEELA